MNKPEPLCNVGGNVNVLENVVLLTLKIKSLCNLSGQDILKRIGSRVLRRFWYNVYSCITYNSYNVDVTQV